MTAFLPARLASFLASHGLVFLSQLTGAIAVTSLILMLIVREVVRGRQGEHTADASSHLLNSVSLALSIVVAIVVTERFLLLK